MRALLLLSCAATVAGAQQVPTRTFAKPELEYGEPFSQIVSLREMRDGRVVVSDARDKTLQVIDLRGNKAAKIGREGSGPVEWAAPGRLLPFLGDSIVMNDAQNTRLLLIAPDARPVRTMSPVPTDGSGSTSSRGGGNGAITFGGGAGANIGSQMNSRMILNSRAVDSRGRFYYQGAGFTIVNGSIASPDSLPIMRSLFGAETLDTIAWTRPAPSTTATGNSGGGISFSRAVLPFQSGDEWVAFPDGRVAVVRVADFHVDVIQADGRMVSGAPVQHLPVRITEAEKEEWRRQLRGSGGGTRVTSFGGGGATPAPAGIPINVPEPATWPETKSAFLANAAWAAPNGDTWVFHSRAASDPIPVAQVFNSQGKLIGRVSLPAKTRLVGFGPKSVYLARLDDDDLQYLQRHPVQWDGCPPTIAEVCAK